MTSRPSHRAATSLSHSITSAPALAMSPYPQVVLASHPGVVRLGPSSVRHWPRRTCHGPTYPLVSIKGVSSWASLRRKEHDVCIRAVILGLRRPHEWPVHLHRHELHTLWSEPSARRWTSISWVVLLHWFLQDMRTYVLRLNAVCVEEVVFEVKLVDVERNSKLRIVGRQVRRAKEYDEEVRPAFTISPLMNTADVQVRVVRVAYMKISFWPTTPKCREKVAAFRVIMLSIVQLQSTSSRSQCQVCGCSDVRVPVLLESLSARTDLHALKNYAANRGVPSSGRLQQCEAARIRPLRCNPRCKGGTRLTRCHAEKAVIVASATL